MVPNALEPNEAKWPARGVNRGGGAWTQYPHYEQRDSLFWRLDSGKPLRLMVDTSVFGPERALASWDGWDRAFQKATEWTGLEPAQFRRVRIRSGKAVTEGTVGAVDVSGCLQREGLTKCMERVCRLHRRFVGETGLARLPQLDRGSIDFRRDLGAKGDVTPCFH